MRTGILIIFLLSFGSPFAQKNELILQKRTNPKRTKSVKLDRELKIKTHDATYVSEIYKHTQDYVTITKPVKLRDEKYNYYLYEKNKDTILTREVWGVDTVKIAASDIEYIKREWSKKRQWLSPFVYVGLGAAVTLPFLPVVALADGKKGVRSLLQVDAVLIGVCAPPIFLATRKTKYNLERKWEIKN